MMIFSCNYCSKKYKREIYLEKHLCICQEKKIYILEEKIKKLEKIIELSNPNTAKVLCSVQNFRPINNLSEILDKLDVKFMETCITNPFNGVLTIIEHVYCKKLKCIKINKGNIDLIYIYKNDKWTIEKKECIFDDMIDQTILYMEKYYDEIIQKEEYINMQTILAQYENKDDLLYKPLYDKINILFMNHCEVYS